MLLPGDRSEGRSGCRGVHLENDAGKQARCSRHDPRRWSGTGAVKGSPINHSTVTLLARLRGLSTSQPRSSAMWYARSCSGTRPRPAADIRARRDKNDFVGPRRHLVGHGRIGVARHGNHRPVACRTSSRFDITLSNTGPCGARNTEGVSSSTSAIGPCFISAAG